MSFFGFETSVPQAPDQSKQTYADEDLAVYTWGEDSYDGLGDALQEVGDDLNDVTFGGGTVGKDFDFSAASGVALLEDKSHFQKTASVSAPNALADSANHSVASNLWGNKAPATAVLKFSNAPRTVEQSLPKQESSASSPSVFSRLDPIVASRTEQRQIHPPANKPVNTIANFPDIHATQPRSLAEIEAEMQAAAMKQQQLLQQQRELEQQQLILHQRAQEEERIREENERIRQFEQRALQDPLWAIRQSMMNASLGDRPNIHERRPSAGIEHPPPPIQQHQHLPVSPSVPPFLGSQPNQQQMILQELLYQQQKQQQQQQFLEQQLNSQNYQLDAEKKQAVMADAQRRIQEAEIMEAKRRRRMSKIQAMSRYNDLMTQSDKDFITRVQLSQLVTSDPYADDFYAQVYASVRLQRSSDSNVLKVGEGGLALGPAESRGPRRRENAIQRMQAQVERLVNNAKSREQQKETAASHGALQHVLGKTSGRSYKAAPRQLLQIAISSPEPLKAHPHAPKEQDSEKLVDTQSHRKELPPPFSRAEALIIIERLFTNILDIEQLRRNKPAAEDQAAIADWNAKLQGLLDEIWRGLRVWGPLYETNPHPFIALITPLKGKRFIGRLGRDLADDQKLTALSVIVNRIEQVDVIRNARILDSMEDSRERRMVEKQAYAFQEHVINQGLQLSPLSRSLRTYNALIEMMIENGPTFSAVVMTRPGSTLLEHFFAEASLLKHGAQSADGEATPASAEDLAKWATTYDRLFEILLPLWTSMFPSSRILPAFPPDSIECLQASLVTDGFDQHIWRFLAGFALEGTQEQHSRLVTQLRAKVMGTLRMAQRLEEGKAKARKIRNVDLFLNALGLSSSQIPVQ